MVIFDEKLEFFISKIYILTTFWQLNFFSPTLTTLNRLPANMSRNILNILEDFQKVEESLDGPEGQ